MKANLLSVFSLLCIFLILIGFLYLFTPKGASAPFVLPRSKTPPTVTPQPQPTITPTQQPNPSPNEPQEPVQVSKHWKMYRNERLGFELKYPKEWFLYNERTLAEDEKKIGGPCVGKSLEDEIILSGKNLGVCVGSAGDNWPGDFNVRHYQEKCSDYYTILPANQYKRTVFKGYSAIIYPFTANSPGPRKIATGMDVYKDGCYHIEFNQTDNKGHYDPVFDEILSTIKFLR